MTDYIKLPWYVYHSGRYRHIYGLLEVDGDIVVAAVNAGGIEDSSRVNAEFIVRSVNAHDKLVSALKHMTEVWGKIVVFRSGQPVGSLSEEYVEALEALRIAEEEVRIDND